VAEQPRQNESNSKDLQLIKVMPRMEAGVTANFLLILNLGFWGFACKRKHA
jgi:hypothetical protein